MAQLLQYMCGIVGVFRKEKSLKLVKNALSAIKYRGKDGVGFYSEDNQLDDCKACFAIGHALHSVVETVRQPLIDELTDSFFLTNCEIYNWQELNKRYDFQAKNDSELLFKFVLKNGVNEKTLSELDGVYAFALVIDNKLYIARDIIGEKPVWYSHSEGLSFASEKKALEKIGCININELNPRKILIYDIKEDQLSLIEREFFSIEKETKESLAEIEKKISVLLKNAIEKRIPNRKFGLLFSGGIDSTVIATILKTLKKQKTKNEKTKKDKINSACDFICYTTVIDDPALKEPKDLAYAKLAAKKLGLMLKIIKIKPTEVEKLLKTIVPLIEDSNVIKAEVALTFFSACAAAKKDGCKVLFSGLGSEEIFAGYQRHKESDNINKECISGLLKLYERDLYRDDVVTMYNGIELRLPYLDISLVRYALNIPGRYKIKDGVEKYILRKAAEQMGVPDEICRRKKKAAQYGSNATKIIDKLTKKSGFKFKSEYMKTFYPTHNLRLGALVSSGKDSIFAMHIMLRQNYSIPIMITIKSKNPDSYMFHTPTIELVKLQSEAIGIPVFVGETPGEKEKELDDLKKIITEAKKRYKLDGIITGAIFSNYQRERIEKICDSLSLKIFSPLWHINQETLIREIISNGFKFIMTKIACDGLDKSWLGKEITVKDVDKLVDLNKKIGINIAGEGGEYETLMVDGPLFKKKIEITNSKIIEEDRNSAVLIILNAGLNYDKKY
jgi:asparagine synthase (glutamine-hydrolysing)